MSENGVEWDYGEYEDLRTAEIRAIRPDWKILQHGCPGGESPAQVSLRADRMILQLRALEGDVAIFSHGHFGRILTKPGGSDWRLNMRYIPTG